MVMVKETQQHVQIVLPSSYHKLVFVQLNENLGHLGSERVIELAKKRFHWPGMTADITTYITKKCRCIKDETPNREQKAPLGTIESVRLFEIIPIDFLHLDRCKGGFEYLLVVVDNFTSFAHAYPTKNKAGKTAADKFYNDFVLNFGFPERIHHDRRGEFNNKLWDKLHQLAGIKKSQTTPYHPMGNGQCERINRTIINMLKTLSKVQKSN